MKNNNQLARETVSMILNANCTSCIPEALCGVMSEKQTRKKRSSKHNTTYSSIEGSSMESSSAMFPNKLPSVDSSSTTDTHLITSRIPFFWRSHPNASRHLRKIQLNQNKTNTMKATMGNVKTLFEHDRIGAFDEAQIAYSATHDISLYSKPSDEVSYNYRHAPGVTKQPEQPAINKVSNSTTSSSTFNHQSLPSNTTNTSSFVEELAPQMELFPECKENNNNLSDVSKSTLPTDFTPSEAGSGWVPFTEFPAP